MVNIDGACQEIHKDLEEKLLEREANGPPLKSFEIYACYKERKDLSETPEEFPIINPTIDGEQRILAFRSDPKQVEAYVLCMPLLIHLQSGEPLRFSYLVFETSEAAIVFRDNAMIKIGCLPLRATRDRLDRMAERCLTAQKRMESSLIPSSYFHESDPAYPYETIEQFMEEDGTAPLTVVRFECQATLPTRWVFWYPKIVDKEGSVLDFGVMECSSEEEAKERIASMAPPTITPSQSDDSNA